MDFHPPGLLRFRAGFASSSYPFSGDLDEEFPRKHWNLVQQASQEEEEEEFSSFFSEGSIFSQLNSSLSLDTISPAYVCM